MEEFLVEVKVWGKYGCFTRPEHKVERLSYPVIPPSAAVGVLEAIYWKPQFRWHVTEIAVLRHPERSATVDWENYMPITLNELAADGQSHPTDGYNIEDHRVQRTCMILRWPCYRIRAKPSVFTSTKTPAQIKAQFYERVERGRCHHQPYLGLREFTAFFCKPEPADAPVETITVKDLGRITHSVVLPLGAEKVLYRTVPLSLSNGIFAVAESEVEG